MAPLMEISIHTAPINKIRKAAGEVQDRCTDHYPDLDHQLNPNLLGTHIIPSPFGQLQGSYSLPDPLDDLYRCTCYGFGHTEL